MLGREARQLRDGARLRVGIRVRDDDELAGGRATPRLTLAAKGTGRAFSTTRAPKVSAPMLPGRFAIDDHLLDLRRAAGAAHTRAPIWPCETTTAETLIGPSASG